MSENIFNHSAEVEMWLDYGQHGKSKLNRIGPRYVILRDPFDAPLGNARLIVFVDGKRIERQVRIMKPMAKGRNVAFVDQGVDLPF